MPNKLSLRGLGQVKVKKKFPETTTLKISENNYSFHLKWRIMGKV